MSERFELWAGVARQAHYAARDLLHYAVFVGRRPRRWIMFIAVMIALGHIVHAHFVSSWNATALMFFTDVALARGLRPMARRAMMSDTSEVPEHEGS